LAVVTYFILEAQLKNDLGHVFGVTAPTGTRSLAAKCAASVDVMKLRKLITKPDYAREGQLLDGIVAMLTR
jgi:hypothetical protein